MVYHCVELAAVLLLLSTGHGVLDAAPHVAARVIRSFAFWVVVFGGAVLLFWSPPVAAWLVRIAMVALVVWGGWWLMSCVVEYLRGPHLLEPPSTEGLAEAAEQISGLSISLCRRLARSILRSHDGYVALLGLGMLTERADESQAAVGQVWEQASEKALASARELAVRYGGAGNASQRAKTADVLFTAQALCLYERRSVERALDKTPAPALGGRLARTRAIRQLEKYGRRSNEAERLNLPSPGETHKERAGEAGKGIGLMSVVWPAWGLFRAGFTERGVAFAVSHGLLLAYGLVALGLDRGSGWVYLAVGAFIHIEGAFAQGDFARSRPVQSS